MRQGASKAALVTLTLTCAMPGVLAWLQCAASSRMLWPAVSATGLEAWLAYAFHWSGSL